MVSTTRLGYSFLVLIAMSGTVTVQGLSLLPGLNGFVQTMMAGIELTKLYLTSGGTKYPPIEEDVTFWCVQPFNKTLVQAFATDPHIHTKLNMTIPIKFVVHGWLGGLYGGNKFLPNRELKEEDGWMHNTSTIWADKEHSNVCSVDWSRLSNYEYAIAAMVNTEMVANHMIAFMNFLITEGMDIKQAAIAGHSLGAQIAGKVGRYYQGLIDAIYGMDPAGPGFTVPWDYGVGARLSEKDANYVQCIHTCNGALGTHKDCGHANFIVNGGLAQPGCITPFCSHALSHDYFDEAMFNGHIFSGVKCTGRMRHFFSKIFGMSCTKDTERLGIYSQRNPGRYFIRTKEAAPYAPLVLDMDEIIVDPDTKLVIIDQKPSDTDEKPAGPDEVSATSDEKSANPVEKLTNLDGNSTIPGTESVNPDQNAADLEEMSVSSMDLSDDID